MGYYLHEVPGRLRVKIPDLKGNPESAGDIQGLLRNVSGIKSVSINTVTGSVIVLHDPESVTAAAVVNILSREGYIDVAKMISKGPEKENTMGIVVQAASKALIGLVLDRALQGSPLSIVTAFI